MSHFEEWLEKEAQADSRRPRLEEDLLFGGFNRYLLYRLRFFLPAAYLRSVVHLAEVAAFYLLLPAQDLPFLMVAILLQFGLEGLWWGALEPMRVRIRRVRQGGNRRAQNRIATYWFKLSLCLFVLILASLLAGVTVLAASTAIGIAEFYVIGRLLAFAVSALAQTLRSSVYAVRRVYRPFWSLLAPDGLHLSIVLLAAFAALPLLLPLAAILRSLFAVVLSAIYAIRSSRAADVCIDFGHAFRFWSTTLPSRRTLAAILPPALGFSAAQASHLYLFAAYWYFESDPDKWAAHFLLLFLAAPLLDASVTWARLFYFDLAKLDSRMLSRFRHRLFKLLIMSSPVIGAVLLFPAIAVAVAAPSLSNASTIALAVALFFSRSLFSITQIRAFCARRYAMLGFTSLSVPILVGGLITLDISIAAEAMSTLALFAISSVILASVREVASPPRAVEPLAVYLTSVASSPGPGAWYVVDLDTERLHAPLADVVKAAAKRTGGVGFYTNGRFVFWLPSSIDLDWALGRIAGLTSRVRRSPELSAPQEGLEAVRTALNCAQPESELGDITADFRRQFPGGLVIDPTRPRTISNAPWMSTTDRRRVLSDIQRSALGISPAASSHSDCTAFFVDGEIAQIFVLPRDVPRRIRSAWRRYVRDASLGAVPGALPS